MGANQSQQSGSGQEGQGRRRKLLKKGAIGREANAENNARALQAGGGRSASASTTGMAEIPSLTAGHGFTNTYRDPGVTSTSHVQWESSLATPSGMPRAKIIIPHRSSVASTTAANSHQTSSTAYSPLVSDGALSNSNTPAIVAVSTSTPHAVDGREPGKPISALEAHNARVRAEQAKVDTQTGERADFTNIWHSLAHKVSDSTLSSSAHKLHLDDESRPPGEPLVASLSAELWQHIATFLSPADAVSLTVASRTLLARIGYGTLATLNRRENLVERVSFLLHMEASLPNHLLCFNCGAYHRRLHPGSERLEAADVLNLLVACPQAGNPTVYVPRLRIVPGWRLPFSLASLAVRHRRLGPAYGIAAGPALDRRWTDRSSGWSHATSFFVEPRSGHLLMRSSSSSPARPDLPPAGIRHLLFDKADYTPHFSVCAHWRDGELLPLVRCALGHVPPARGPNLVDRAFASAQREISQGVTAGRPVAVGGGTGPAGQCAYCKPMRRCPECPTEYLIELRLVEETARMRRNMRRAAGGDPRDGDGYDDDGAEFVPIDNSGRRRKPQTTSRRAGANAPPRLLTCISVTRWSDLGDGKVPFAAEWAACAGSSSSSSSSSDHHTPPHHHHHFDSFAKVGARTIAGTFEARFGESNAAQRLLNLNPRGEKKGIEGHRWW